MQNTDEKKYFIKVNTFIKSIIGALIWFPFIFRYLLGILKNIELISYILSREELIIILEYRYAIYTLIILISSLIFKEKNKKAFIFWYILYILGFPFIVIYKILSKYIPISLKIFNIVYEKLKNIKKIHIQLYILFLDLLCFYLIIKSFSVRVIYASTLLLFFLLISHLYFLFSLTLAPLAIINKFYFYIFNEAWTYIKKTFFNEKEKNKVIESKKDSLRSQIKMYGKMYNYLFNKVYKIYDKQAILSLFIVLFFISLSFTIIVFSTEYYALIKLNSNNFIIIGDNNFINCLYYSISNFSTINLESILPQSNLAKLLVISQTFIGIFIFYIFIVSFAALSPELFKEASKNKNNILDKYNEIKDYLNNLSNNEFNVNLEELTKEKIFILKHNRKK